MSTSDMGLLEYLAWLERQEAELQRKMDEIRVAKDHARRAAKEMSGAPTLGDRVENPKGDRDTVDGKYASMRPRQAALAYLKERGGPATTIQIREALEAGNVKTEAEAFHQTLYNTLQRMAKKDQAVVNYGHGLWGLPVWPRPGEAERLSLLS